MNRFWALLGCFVALPIAVAQSPTPADRLLAQVPGQAALVVVVPNIQAAVSGVAAFGKSIGVAELEQLETRALLEEIDLLDRVEGLDIGGPLLLAQVPDQAGPLILCAVKDADAWKDVCQAKELEDGLLRVHMFDESGYAAIKGDVLILGEQREIVQGALKADGKFAERFKARAGRLLATHHVAVYADVASWQPRIEAALTTGRSAIQAGLAMQAPQADSALAVWMWFFKESDRLVREMEVWTAGLRVDAEGVFAEDALTFRAAGYAAEYLKKVRKTDRALLRGLPAADSALVLACEWEVPPGTKSLSASWLEAMLGTDALKEKLGDETFEKGMQAITAMHELMTGYNMTMATAPDGAGLVISGLYFTEDPPALVQHMCRAYETSVEFMDPFGDGSAVDVTVRSERIASIEVQAIDMVFTMEDVLARRTLEAIYGNPATVYSLPRAEGALFAFGPTEAARAQMSRMLADQAGKLLDDSRAAAAGKSLSPDPQVYLLADLPKLADFAMDVARTAGAPLPQFKFSKQPAAFVAFGAYLEPDQIRGELFVPAEPIKVVVEGVRALKQKGCEE